MKPAEAAFPGRNGDIVFAGGKPGERYIPLVYRVRPDGSGVKRLAEGAFVSGLDYSADGRKLVWSEDTCPDEGYDCNTLFVANANGTGQHPRSEEHTSELQSRQYLVCRLLLEKKKNLQPSGRIF